MTIASPLTTAHVFLSLIGIGSGLIVFFGMLMGRRLDVLTGVFLVTTIATSATGFLFPFEHILPSHGVGILSLALLGPALAARYVFKLAGESRPVFVVCSGIALYLNVFVFIIQAFRKIPALRALAPTQTEGPSVITHLLTLLIVAALTVGAIIRFKER